MSVTTYKVSGYFAIEGTNR